MEQNPKTVTAQIADITQPLMAVRKMTKPYAARAIEWEPAWRRLLFGRKARLAFGRLDAEAKPQV